MKTTLYWSLGGHAALLIFLLLTSLIASCSRNRTVKEVHVFRLQAGPPAPRVEPSATPPTARVEPTPTPTAEPEPQTATPPEKKPEPKPTPKPVQAKPEPKPESNPVRYEDFVKTHELPKSEPQARPTPPTPTQASPDPNRQLREQLDAIIQGFGGTDASSDELQELNRYVSQLRTQLNRLWLQPTGLPSGKWSALIEFTVERNGRITGVRFKQRSGNALFDQSLIRAMNAFKTTAPPPGGKAQVFAIPFSMTVH